MIVRNESLKSGFDPFMSCVSSLKLCATRTTEMPVLIMINNCGLLLRMVPVHFMFQV